MDSLRQRIRGVLQHGAFRNSSMLGLAQVSTALVGFVTQVVATRGLGVDTYGRASIAIALPAMVWAFSSVKSISIATRYVAIHRRDDSPVRLLSVLKLSLLIDLATALFSFSVVMGIGLSGLLSEQQQPLFGAMAIYACATLVRIPIGSALSVLNGYERFDRIATINVMGAVVTLLGTVAVVALGGNLLPYMAMLVGVEAWNTGMSVMWGLKTLRQHGPLPWRQARLSELHDVRAELRHMFGWNYALATLSGMASSLPPLLLGNVPGVGTRNAAYFRLGHSLATVLAFPESALSNVMMPRLSRRHTAGARQVLVDLLRRGTLQVGLPLGLAVGVGILLTPWMVRVFYGAEYTPATTGVQWMLVSVVLSGLFFWLQPFYYSRGKLRSYATGQIVAGGVVVGALLVAPTFEVGAMAYVTGRLAGLLLNLALAFRLQEPSAPTSSPAKTEADEAAAAGAVR